MAGLTEGFVYLFSEVVFGSPALFFLFFALIIIGFLIFSKCSVDQMMIFLLIPAWFFRYNLLGGILGGTIVALIVMFNGFILYKNITKLIN